MAYTAITKQKLERALQVMRDELPSKFHMKPRATTEALGMSGPVLKLHLGCRTWKEVYDDFVHETRNPIPEPGYGKETPANHPKRLNPDTGKPFVNGERVNDEVFVHYKLKEVNQYHEGYAKEYWTNWEQFKRKHCNDVFTKSKVSAAKRNFKGGKGIPWNISDEKKVEMLETLHCECCGVRLRMPWEGFPRVARTGPVPTSFSIDRMDNEIGYVDSNVKAICHGCNTMKGSASLSEVIERAKRLTEYMAS